MKITYVTLLLLMLVTSCIKTHGSELQGQGGSMYLAMDAHGYLQEQILLK